MSEGGQTEKKNDVRTTINTQLINASLKEKYTFTNFLTVKFSFAPTKLNPKLLKTDNSGKYVQNVLIPFNIKETFLYEI